MVAPAVEIVNSNVRLLATESFIRLSPDLGPDTLAIVAGNTLIGPNKTLFTPDVGSPQIIETVIDDPLTGTLSAFADNGSGGTTVTPVGGITGFNNGQTIVITGTTSYNGTFIMSSVGGSTFDIPTPFVADDATGNYDASSITITITAHGYSNGDFIHITESNSYNGFYELFEVTTDTFNVSSFFVSNQTGIVDKANSLNETDPRVLTSLNPGFNDSSYLAAFSIVENAIVTEIASSNTFQNFDISGKSGAITVFADAGGGFTTVTSAAHGLIENEPVQILDNPNGYAGAFRAVSVTTNTFDIPVTFTVTGTGNFLSNVLSDEDIQRFRISNETKGEWEYIGNEPFDGLVTTTIAALKTGSDVNYNFILCVNNVLDVRSPYVGLGVKTTLRSVTLVSAVKLVKGDVMNIQVSAIGSTDNLTIQLVSFLAQRK